MLEMIKKNWITILGGLFIFTAFLYLFKLAIEEGWVIPEARVALGLVAGLTGLYFGHSLYRRNRILGAELSGGLGSAIIYATIAYASFTPEIQWSTTALLISIGSFTGLIAFAGYKLELRWLSFISILGGLVTPLVLKAPEAQVMLLFIYVLVLNMVSLYLSGVRQWPELRVMSFVVTALIYVTYYIYFDPLGWQEPTFYVSTLFLVYFIGLIATSFYENREFEGLNLYLGLVNAVNFVFWSMFIFSSFGVSYMLPTLIVAILFIGGAFFMHHKSREEILAPMAYFLIGVVLIAISGGDLASRFTEGGLNYLINASLWWLLLVGFYATCRYVRINLGRDLSIIGWIMILVYWYSTAWSVEWMEWFGLPFIPFLNPGALLWIALAATGFYFSGVLQKRFRENGEAYNAKLDHNTSIALGVVSHIVVGGLLTIQIQNLWEAYELSFIKDHVMMSFSFAVYALTLFLWGAYTDQTPFRVMGSTVLIATAIKVFLIDLSGSSTIYMVLFLLFLGALTLTIAKIDQRWRHRYSQS